jgi:hypothetical protein
MFTRLFWATLLALATALIIWPDMAYAQGPQDVCVIPDTDPAYEAINTIELIDTQTFYCVSGDCVISAGSSIRVDAGFNHVSASGTFTTEYTLPSAFNAFVVSLTVPGFTSGRTGNVTIYFNDGPIAQINSIPSSGGTYTTTVAQALSYSDVITVSMAGSGAFSLNDIQLTPTTNLSKTTLALRDPDGNGIDYPSWVISDTTIINAGSRTTGGSLTMERARPNQPYCTPIGGIEGTAPATVTLTFDASAGGNFAGEISAALVDSYPNALSADYSAVENFSFGSPGSISLSIPYTDTITPNYICLRGTGYSGSLGDLSLDNFNTTACEDAGGALIPNCLTISDYNFDSPPSTPPALATDWATPVLVPGYPLYYDAPPIITSTAVLSTYGLITAQISDTVGYPAYNITVRAEASGEPLEIGLAETISTAGSINHWQSQTQNVTGTFFTSATTTINADELYTVTLFNPITVTIPYVFLRAPAGAVSVYEVCVTGYTTSTVTTIPIGQCLTLVQNPNFDDEYGWHYGNGATHNPTALNAWLPYVISGTWENTGLSVVGQAITDTLPGVEAGQALALSFKARSIDGKGYVTAVLEDVVGTRHTLATDEFYQTYTLDVTALASATTPSLYFVNTGYQYGSEQGVFIDEVCLFITNSFTQTAVNTSPNQVNTSLSCWNISYWLSDTLGIDFPGLETIVNDGVSIWDAENWVSWLGAQLWTNAAKPIVCVMLAMLRTQFFLDIMNVAQWIGGAIVSLANWLAEIWTAGLLAWLDWNGRVVVMIWQWFASGARWLLDLTWQGIQYAVGSLVWWALFLFNFAVKAWNLLLPSLSLTGGQIMDSVVGMWNWLAEFLSEIWGWFSFGWNTVLDVLWGLWDTFYLTLQILWNSFSDISEFPLTFYQNFNNGINGSIIEILPQCTTGSGEDWCMIVVGFEVVNQTVSHTIAYPLVIISIIGLTILIFWSHIKNIFSLRIN